MSEIGVAGELHVGDDLDVTMSSHAVMLTESESETAMQLNELHTSVDFQFKSSMDAQNRMKSTFKSVANIMQKQDEYIQKLESKIQVVEDELATTKDELVASGEEMSSLQAQLLHRIRVLEINVHGGELDESVDILEEDLDTLKDVRPLSLTGELASEKKEEIISRLPQHYASHVNRLLPLSKEEKEIIQAVELEREKEDKLKEENEKRKIAEEEEREEKRRRAEEDERVAEKLRLLEEEKRQENETAELALLEAKQSFEGNEAEKVKEESRKVAVEKANNRFSSMVNSMLSLIKLHKGNMQNKAEGNKSKENNSEEPVSEPKSKLKTELIGIFLEEIGEVPDLVGKSEVFVDQLIDSQLNTPDNDVDTTSDITPPEQPSDDLVEKAIKNLREEFTAKQEQIQLALDAYATVRDVKDSAEELKRLLKVSMDERFQVFDNSIKELESVSAKNEIQVASLMADLKTLNEPANSPDTFDAQIQTNTSRAPSRAPSPAPASAPKEDVSEGIATNPGLKREDVLNIVEERLGVHMREIHSGLQAHPQAPPQAPPETQSPSSGSENTLKDDGTFVRVVDGTLQAPKEFFELLDADLKLTDTLTRLRRGKAEAAEVLRLRDQFKTLSATCATTDDISRLVKLDCDSDQYDSYEPAQHLREAIEGKVERHVHSLKEYFFSQAEENLHSAKVHAQILMERNIKEVQSDVRKGTEKSDSNLNKLHRSFEALKQRCEDFNTRVDNLMWTEGVRRVDGTVLKRDNSNAPMSKNEDSSNELNALKKEIANEMKSLSTNQRQMVGQVISDLTDMQKALQRAPTADKVNDMMKVVESEIKKNIGDNVSFIYANVGKILNVMQSKTSRDDVLNLVTDRMVELHKQIKVESGNVESSAAAGTRCLSCGSMGSGIRSDNPAQLNASESTHRPGAFQTVPSGLIVDRSMVPVDDTEDGVYIQGSGDLSSDYAQMLETVNRTAGLRGIQRQYSPMKSAPHPYLKKSSQPPEPLYRRAKLASHIKESVKISTQPVRGSALEDGSFHNPSYRLDASHSVESLPMINGRQSSSRRV
jgi:hypothetical protein